MGVVKMALLGDGNPVWDGAAVLIEGSRWFVFDTPSKPTHHIGVVRNGVVSYDYHPSVICLDTSHAPTQTYLDRVWLDYTRMQCEKRIHLDSIGNG